MTKYTLISRYKNEIIHTDSERERKNLISLGYSDYKEPSQKTKPSAKRGSKNDKTEN